MIDDKKIEEAATVASISDTEKGRVREGYVINALADHENGFREGYIEGAKGAINEFLKDLWHLASEEPDVRHKTIICLYEDGDIRQDNDVYDEAITHDTFLGIGEFNWNDYAESEDIEKWCYKNELFQKEGGEQ